MKLLNRIEQIILEILKLKRICYPNFNFKINYLTIFSESKDDFKNLEKELRKIGKEEIANNGFKYLLKKPINYKKETISLIRVRKPDIHRKELGCADLIYKSLDYPQLRKIALDKGYDLIVRKDYEMIELSDFNINVYAYLVKDL